jgi:hypothetical protein
MFKNFETVDFQYFWQWYDKLLYKNFGTSNFCLAFVCNIVYFCIISEHTDVQKTAKKKTCITDRFAYAQSFNMHDSRHNVKSLIQCCFQLFFLLKYYSNCIIILQWEHEKIVIQTQITDNETRNYLFRRIFLC